MTREQANRARAEAQDRWEPRDEIAQRYGVKLSNVYAVLSNRAHHDPTYSRSSLAKPLRATPSGATPWEVVDEIRRLRQSRYETLSALARAYGLEETTVYGILMNRSRVDPGYDPSTLVTREDLNHRTPRTTGYIYGLYCACGDCDPNKIQYVGQTVQDPEKRLSAHRKPHGKDRYTKRAKWVLTHGPGNIRARVLETDPPDGLDLAEQRNIREYGTLVPDGYNMTPGGYAGAGRSGVDNNSAKLTRAQVCEIVSRFEEPDATSRSLAADYNVTKTLILKIDHGDLWPDVPRPQGTHRLNRNRRMSLTNEDVLSIRERHARGERVASIARDLGESWHVVNNVVKGKTWREVV